MWLYKLRLSCSNSFNLCLELEAYDVCGFCLFLKLKNMVVIEFIASPFCFITMVEALVYFSHYTSFLLYSKFFVAYSSYSERTVGLTSCYGIGNSSILMVY